MNYVVKPCVYQINFQTKIINSIKNDTIKIYQENIYSFNVQDIQKKALAESLHHLFFDISATVTIILINFLQFKMNI